ncbi:MAG: SIMPL domain-containing protein [bacterium]|nr:SIMPL domain-containing protein [bacterium]
MNNKIKNYLGVAIIVVLLFMAYATVSYVKTYSRSIQPSSFRSFSVSAEGKVVAVPDVAQFTFGVKTEGGLNIADLQTENTKKVNQAIDFAKSNGVEAKDIKTTNYSLTPRYQYFSCPVRDNGVTPCPPAEIVGYTVSQTVSVKIRNFEKIGDILAGVVKNGANEVSSLSFAIDDATLVQDQARNEAITKAKVRAISVAKAGGFKLGRLLSIEESATPVYYNYATKAAGMGISDESATPSAPPAIEAGSQEVSVTMILKYEIE